MRQKLGLQNHEFLTKTAERTTEFSARSELASEPMEAVNRYLIEKQFNSAYFE